MMGRAILWYLYIYSQSSCIQTAPLKMLTGKEMVYVLNDLINNVDVQPKKNLKVITEVNI